MSRDRKTIVNTYYLLRSCLYTLVEHVDKGTGLDRPLGERSGIARRGGGRLGMRDKLVSNRTFLDVGLGGSLLDEGGGLRVGHDDGLLALSGGLLARGLLERGSLGLVLLLLGLGDGRGRGRAGDDAHGECAGRVGHGRRCGGRVSGTSKSGDVGTKLGSGRCQASVDAWTADSKLAQ